MNLFAQDKMYNITVEPQALLLKPFAAIYKRDKTKGKVKATKEMAFIYYFCDIKSDYAIHTDLKIKTELLKEDLDLGKSWKIDKIIQEGIDFYKKRSLSITAKILSDSMYVANKISGQLKEQVDVTLDVNEIDKVLAGLKKIPDVIKALKLAEKEVIKEIEQAQDNVGSKEKALFEDLQLMDGGL